MSTRKVWTDDEVERRLIAAFRFLPGHPVYSDGHRLTRSSGDRDGHVTALNWGREFLVDQQSMLALLTWARCRASGDSVRERYHALGWSRSTAEKARRRALSRIIAGLNS